MTDSMPARVPVPVDAAQWQVLTDAAALADLSATGRLSITGTDALDLLNRLTTNRLEALPAGEARSTVVTNGNGRVIDLLHLAALPDSFLCLTSPGRVQAVIDWLDTYTFGEDITVTDRSEETALFALAGPDAARVLATADVDPVPEAPHTVTQAAVGPVDAVLWRSLPGGADGFYIIAEAEQKQALRDALLFAGAAVVSETAWDAYRIGNGFPVYNAEFDESTNPLEARLRGIISEDKGCYTGQEVIARLLTYRKIQRKLMAVDLSASAAPDTELTADGASAGRLTSVAVLPDSGAIGLALIPMKHAVPGATLQVGDAVVATLREPAYALATEPEDD